MFVHYDVEAVRLRFVHNKIRPPLTCAWVAAHLHRSKERAG